jgi:Domain of unknown function (DUF4962)/Heparinase II/III-like protein
MSMVSPGTAFLALAMMMGLPCEAQESLPDGVHRAGPAELKIERKTIGESAASKPMPQGTVDANPPWLHVQVALPAAKKEAKAQQWQRRFYFKLSQDPELKRNVIESGPKRWSFYNPYRTLERGTWYWTYGVAPAETPEAPAWHKEVFSFLVDDQAFAPAIPPTPEQALAAIRKHQSGPVAICLNEDIGRMLPEKTWPEAAVRLRKQADQALRDGERPVRVELSEKDIPAHLGKAPKESFFMVKLRSLFTAEERRVDALLRGYLLTGDERFKKLGVQRAVELEHLRLTKVFDTPAGRIPMTRPAYYNTVPMLVLDAFREDLPEEQRATFSKLALGLIDKHGNGFPLLHDQLEHAHFNQHDWQGDIKNLLIGSAVLCRHVPEMDDWFSYAYELWLYRSPALSRSDGGSMDGNGYLGVHEEPLTHLNWMLMRLTGYNFFKSKRWFSGFPEYMSYMNPVGNPGVPFSDGGDVSPGVPYLTEMLAYVCPENPANLWRFKAEGRRSAADFSGDLVKGYKAMAMLQMWRQFPAPDLSKAPAPADSAAVFRDVGMAAMHSDILDPARNLAVSFTSAVNGSFQHLHPSQNAFCVGYGGEPLFWRTGYYNGGQAHDAMSYKASRAHNTLLVDGCMQGFDLGAYGWMPRFATGSRISYALGDASNAYNGMFPKYKVTEPDKPLPPGLEALGVPITRENGFGKPGVTRFRRHLVMLRPSHLLILDELEAVKPVTWTFQLHSLQVMQQRGNAWFTTANGKGTGGARLFCTAPVVGSVTDRFFAPAVDEENKRGGKNPPHWHATIATREKLAATRFMTIIEVQPGATRLGEPVAIGEGTLRWQLGDYQVSADMDPARPSLLEIRDRSGTCALVTGEAAAEISLGMERRSTKAKGSTLLWERPLGKPEIFREVVDQLPPVLVFGNRY